MQTNKHFRKETIPGAKNGRPVEPGIAKIQNTKRKNWGYQQIIYLNVVDNWMKTKKLPKSACSFQTGET